MGITKLTLAPQQKQQLNLHLVQQMKLLQLGALELEQYVQEAVEANPLLEFPSEVTGPALAGDGPGSISGETDPR